MTLMQGFEIFLFIIVAGVITAFAMNRANILLRVIAALSWLGLAFAVFTESFGFDLDDATTIFFGVVFTGMAFVSLLIQLDTEIVRESKGIRWTEWGSKPEERGESSYEKYRREMIRRRIGERRRGRK